MSRGIRPASVQSAGTARAITAITETATCGVALRWCAPAVAEWNRPWRPMAKIIRPPALMQDRQSAKKLIIAAIESGTCITGTWPVVARISSSGVTTPTHLISFDADGDRASQLRHAVQGQDSDGNFGGTTLIFTKVQ